MTDFNNEEEGQPEAPPSWSGGETGIDPGAGFPQAGGTDSYLGGGITGTQDEMRNYESPGGIGGPGGTHRENTGGPPGIAPTGTGVEGLQGEEEERRK